VLYRTLQRFPGQVTWRTLELGQEGDLGGLAVEPIPAPGKPPIHLEGSGSSDAGDNIGLLIRDGRTGKRLATVRPPPRSLPP